MTASEPATQFEGPPGRPTLFTRGDKRWAICFAITLVVLWTLPFLFGLSPSTFGSLGLIALLAWMTGPPALLCGLLLVALTSPFIERGTERRFQKFAGRLGLLVISLFVWAMMNGFGGGPWGIGRLCAAKWGIGLDAIRSLQASEAVVAIGKGETRKWLEVNEIPESLDSIYWGHPKYIVVNPSRSGPPSLEAGWGGGFYRWGIVTGAEGECPLSEEDYQLISWADDVWVFMER